MGQDTKIQWTDRTWNPVRGCSRISPGCTSCYAERHAGRFAGPGLPFAGFARIRRTHETLDVVRRDGSISQKVHSTSEARWTGKVALLPAHLREPMGWRRPARVFVNSMSDLFHEGLSDYDIARVFGVMAACPQHTFQVLTKRAQRAREWFDWAKGIVRHEVTATSDPSLTVDRWPLPNVWLGVSVEDQQRADERIPVLLDIPAAVRFVSAEPLLGEVDLERVRWPEKHRVDVLRGGAWDYGGIPGFLQHSDMKTLDWVIVGGESGPGARPFDLTWARTLVDQCAAAGAACFVKQVGSVPVSSNLDDYVGHRTFMWQGGLAQRLAMALQDRKGGDPSEWPEDLRVRQFPTLPPLAASPRVEKEEVPPAAARETPGIPAR